MADSRNTDSVEIWKAVPGWEHSHQVSNMGEVRSLDRTYLDRCGRKRQCKGRLLRTFLRTGYPSVELNCGGRARKFFVHTLVCAAFHGEPEEGQEVAHSDGVRLNGRADNLRWASRKDNHADKRLHGTHQEGERHPMAKLSERHVRHMRGLHARGATQIELAAKFNTDQANVSLIVRRKTWSHI